MEQQEKKKRRTQSRSTLCFPIDLTTEILLRLPEKSVLRFRCVSKLWSSITTDPYFVKLFETRPSTKPSLLLCFRKHEKLFAYSIPQHTQNSNKDYFSSQPIDPHHMKLPRENSYLSTGTMESVDGLICFVDSGNKPIVWNLSKRQFLTLPKPDKSWKYIRVFLGYDPIEGKHKVMCIPYVKPSYFCRVLTLGSTQESWRTVEMKHKHLSGYYSSGRCMKGVIYYLAPNYTVPLGSDLMSFDVRSEKFDIIEIPSNINADVLIIYKGRPACVGRRNNGLLILEDAEKHKWSSLDFLVPLGHYDKSLDTYFKIKGFTHAGEFIYLPPKFHKSCYILFYDPVRNCHRRVELKGIADDESWLDNRVGNPMYDLYAFPNHIESVISL